MATAGSAALRAAAAALLVAAGVAQANDRPFLITTNAVMEDDDDAPWAFETFWQRVGRVQGLTVAPEYSFNPAQSLQLLYTRSRERDADAPPATLEFEYKHVLNNIARDGYGFGWHLSYTIDDAPNDAGSKRWRSERLATRALYTLPFKDGDAMLHLNAGIGKSRGERREWVGSAVFEHKLPGRVHAFVEVGFEEQRTLLHTGIRHWVKKERFAIDISVQQLRGEGRRDSGLVIGFGWYDF